MKRFFTPIFLSLLPLVAGLSALASRFWLYSALDDRGLLPVSHPARGLSFVIAALFFLALLLILRRYPRQNKPALLFPASIPGAAGCWAGALGVLIAVFSGSRGDIPVLVWLLALLGILAAGAMAYLGWCRLRHLKPTVLAHMAVLLFFILFSIDSFRHWWILPQSADYIYPLLAGVSLILTAYYRGIVADRPGFQKRYLLCNRSAVFFCIVSIQSGNRLFYLAAALWAAGDLCRPGEEMPNETA